MRIETIETKRLLLRGYEKTDVDFAISVWNDPEMGEYLADLSEENLSEEERRELENLGESESCCYLISVSKETGDRIGTCSFIPSEDGQSYDIAYCVHKKYWRQGYATEMIQGMVAYARQQGAEKITVTVDQKNAASNGVMKKLGFRIAGENSYRKRGTERICEDYLYEMFF